MALNLVCLVLPFLLTGSHQQDPVNISLSKDATKLPIPTEEQSLALETLNGFRSLHGLQELKLDRRLLASSLIHAQSMSKRNVLDHKGSNEEQDNAMKRAAQFGYDGPVAELVASGLPNAPYAVVSFIDAPYHRRLLLKPGALDFGCSQDGNYTCFVLGGTASPQVVLSPPPSSDGVPTFWDGREEPSPVRGMNVQAPFGYPITVFSYGSDSFKFVSCSLADSNGNILECIVKTPENDSECKAGLIIIPKKTFASKSIYTVSAQFEIDGSLHKETWSFRTGSETIPVSKKKSKKSG